ncbi:X-ray repair cross-complementing protein 6-like isoform X2 [Homalodisca vitripennis]|uniref:X-ray repair cross-complementing protein 6-like isoform X1 n=1 Tax=Homalodisca vitripennis TaxID=197043 RepID=UPI001EE9BC6A|nr:X-ray repair cross-complementing protein 6-like isoform X1 [Homalodisca vitripennis]XP_046682113.1 X-ray repair cross-complementing protein 6-like isoform X2 [Homalodisca vitripennis]
MSDIMASEDDASIDQNEIEKLGGKSGVIFLIDCRPSMFSESVINSENVKITKFITALQCFRTVLLNKMTAQQQDLIGLVLFGTANSNPKDKLKNISCPLDLAHPNVDYVKQIDLMMSDTNAASLQRTYSSSEQSSLADALWYCSSLFSQSGSSFEEKRILLFTDDSDPHSADADQAHKARKRAKDLNQLNISLELLPMGTNFDYSTFYKELLEIVNGFSDTEVDATSKLEELLVRVKRLDSRTRRHAKLKWNLGNGVSLGVSLYTSYREASILPKEPLYRATNESVRRIKQTYDQATGQLLLPSDVSNYVTVAGKDIVFTKEEKEMMYKLEEPELTLLGFKPLTSAKEGLHFGPSSFAYAEETLIKGSKELMKGLVMQCIAKQNVALCLMTSRYRAATKYVYLLPCDETFDSDGNLQTSLGFHVIPVPYYNDAREQKFGEKSPEVTNEVKLLAKKLLTKLKFVFKPSDFKNEKLQLFWEHLEALALGHLIPNDVEDQTLPDKAAQTERLGPLNKEFNNACSLNGEDTSTCPATKRPAPETSGSPAKKVKQPLPTEDLVKQIKSAIIKREVDRFTVAQIKEFLSLHKKNVTGLRKASLIEAVYKLKF